MKCKYQLAVYQSPHPEFSGGITTLYKARAAMDTLVYIDQNAVFRDQSIREPAHLK